MMLKKTVRRSPSLAARLSRASLITASVLGALLSGGCGESPAPPPAGPAQVATTSPAPSVTAAQAAEVKAAPSAGISLAQLLDVHRSFGPRAAGDSFIYLSDAPGTAQIFAPAGEDAGDPKAAPRQITSYPDRVSGLRVAPGGKVAIFLKDAGGDENDQIFRLSLEGANEATALTDAPKVKHTLPSFDEKGARIAYTSNARNGKDMDLYVDALPAGGAKAGDAKDAKGAGAKDAGAGGAAGGAGGKKAPLVELTGSHAVQDFRGDKVIVSEVRGSFDQDLWIVDVKTKKKKILTKHTGDERYDWARFSRDGRAVFTLTDAGREHLSLVAIDVASGKRTPIVEADHDVMLASIAPPVPADPKAAPKVEDVIVFALNKDGTEEVHAISLDAARKEIKRSPTGLTGVIGTIDVAPGGGAAFVSMDRANLPTEVFRADLAAGTSSRVTFSHHAGIDESKLVREELLTLQSFDKKTISLFWYATPAQSGEKRPVIIMIHGGPEGQWQPNWNPLAQYFALHGYGVAAPNVRGSTGYGKTFAHLDDKEKREDSVKDLAEVGKFLAARPDVDGSNLVLYGGSYGGYMVLAGLTLYPEQWAAGIDVVGIANFRTFLEQTAPYRRALREAEYGSLEKDGAFLDRVSPINRVDKIRSPLMVIHGTRDPRVPIGEARQIAEALKKRGVPVELLTFEDEGHGLAKRKNKLLAYPAVVEFLDKHVKRRK
jgi:dipeptidyl aminopeptidase/acylaminoacyl peptidase